MYDSRLNQSTLTMLAWAPLIYCASAAWTFSNQQVFRNEVVIDTTVLLFPPVHHSVLQYVS